MSVVPTGVGFAVVGLTGGIGSGKSTVARYFSALGVPVVDADQVAREVVAKGSEGLRAVIAEFGEEVLNEDGTLDRKKVGERVFGDDQARGRLEAILHPRIAAASMAKLTAFAQDGHAYAIYEAALLVENKSHQMMGALIVVAVDEATQIARVQARDDLDVSEAKARIASQLPLADKIAVADYVVENDGSLAQTEARVRAIHEALLARFGDE